MPKPSTPFIGVVSDTHSRYDERLDDLLSGATHILHAGDIGTSNVLTRLKALAPVTAVLGNTDLPFWDDGLPWEAQTEVLGLRILICHIGRSLTGRHDPAAEGFDLVVSGHTHKAAVDWREDTLFLNPGTAGAARFGGPRTLARVRLAADGRADPEIVPLD